VFVQFLLFDAMWIFSNFEACKYVGHALLLPRDVISSQGFAGLSGRRVTSLCLSKEK
jgi:hypothetical protein